jgi:lipopolysaccharide/colanic/teichoic acid biosynthesis glycosyltransferase
MTALVGGAARWPIERVALGAGLGRAAIVAVATAVPFAGRAPAAILVTAVFGLCLQWSLAGSAVVVGPVTAAAAAALTGFVLTSVIAVWLPSLGLGGTALLATAVATVLLVVPFEHLLRRRVPPRHEDPVGRVPPRQVASDWVSGLPLRRRRSLGGTAKRAFDLVVAVAALILTAPVWPVLALLVARTGRPVFVHQPRVGELDRVFMMHKFRTMRPDAEPEGLAVWAEESDPRVTRSGRFMRGTHLDELPQLWNVLMGDMSIVGPRPERPELVTMLEQVVPHWTGRQLVKPGMTGWAQIRQGYASDVDGSEEKLSYDLWYVRHRSLMLDVAICMSTLPRLFARSGAR